VFGLTFEKLLVIGVIAVFVLGPERLPRYAAQLGRLIRAVRDIANGAKDRVKDEMGEEFNDVDWKKLDPRQYDPRRIIREALLEDEITPPNRMVTSSADSASSHRVSIKKEEPRSNSNRVGTPFDSEAT
jgi:sec-independent protein translocase protein TatB